MSAHRLSQGGILITCLKQSPFPEYLMYLLILFIICFCSRTEIPQRGQRYGSVVKSTYCYCRHSVPTPMLGSLLPATLAPGDQRLPASLSTCTHMCTRMCTHKGGPWAEHSFHSQKATSKPRPNISVMYLLLNSTHKD